MGYPSVPPNITAQEDAKQAVVEQTLMQAFNPFSALQNNQVKKTTRGAVVTYAVQEGDTLSDIAYKYGITLQDLIEENKITNPNMVGIGMKLNIRRDEVAHVVTRGETLDQIASRYDVKKEVLIRRNPLLAYLQNQLYVGQTVVVPMPAAKPALAGNIQLRRQMAQAASRKASRSRAMSWPIKEPTITSGFGSRWGKMHKGLDMWNEEEAKTPIQAAKEGIVVEAGANRAGYGYLVVLDHGGGLQTFYAHMRKISVYVGQEVDEGDILGYMGNTGDSTGYHLHFEVRQDDIPVNPMPYLRR
ncbi:peptidoglycan DD-metalloendopeptidase family protein [Brevibacillus migulae]|uniref:peptidoglycan DD-metalloendopeptidase family protein n=1 Tax=Brevibacillus migulae TaxID=1644114 RepID=UPI0038B30D9D